MNKYKKAKDFVLHGIRSTDFRKKSSMSFLPLNILLVIVSILLCQEILLIWFEFFLILINIVSAIVFYKKWSTKIGFISQGSQMLFCLVVLDIVCYSMYKCADCFVWIEFLILIIIQIVFLGLWISTTLIYYKFFDGKYYKYFDDKTLVIKNRIAVSIGGLIGILSVIIFIHLFVNVTLQTVFLIISTLINMMIYLLEYGIVLAFFTAYLVSKYKIKIE